MHINKINYIKPSKAINTRYKIPVTAIIRLLIYDSTTIM